MYKACTLYFYLREKYIGKSIKEIVYHVEYSNLPKYCATHDFISQFVTLR